MCALVVISPATTASPVVTSVSQATRPFGSWRMTSSSTESEIWSAILSGCPSVTDSDVNKKLRNPSLKPLSSYESCRLSRAQAQIRQSEYDLTTVAPRAARINALNREGLAPHRTAESGGEQRFTRLS